MCSIYRLALAILLVTLSGCNAGSNPQITVSASGQVPLGVNLNYNRHTLSQLIFVDLFKQSEAFGADTNTFPASCVDSKGWPTQSPCQGVEANYPAGTYTLVYEGIGTIEMGGAATGIFTQAGSYSVPVNPDPSGPGGGGILLTIKFSDPGDPVRNIQFYLPGYGPESDPIYPPFIDRLKIFQTIRYMDLMETNNNPLVAWSDRRPIDYATQTGARGVSPEYIYEIANRAQADPWINIPHMADDGYVKSLAALLRDNLDPGRKLYVEYSNEVWNSGFAAAGYATSQGKLQGLSQNDKTAKQMFYVKRSLEIFDIFAQEFGGNNRLVTMIATQTSQSTYSDELLSFLSDPAVNPKNLQVDALAFSSYFGGKLIDTLATSGLLSTLDTSTLLDLLENEIDTNMSTFGQAQNAVAAKYGLPTIGYEGGQSINLGGNPAYLGDEDLIATILAANRDPRMKDLVKKMYDTWWNNGGDVLNYYMYTYDPEKCCNWGALEWQDQPTSQAPKYMALEELAEEYSGGGSVF